MRELSNREVDQVSGGNPLVAGGIGAVVGGIAEYSGGGSIGDVAMGSAMGFATGFFGSIAVAARSIYYGGVTIGMAILTGARGWQDKSDNW
ncbi:MAG: hypothetical protein Q7L07_16695 [Pseudohongiella sp.]|nr:hypothetical protein [Pseudohongiella sp.]MDP2282642.1 hypothetical protein [Pseudohongiella sp.]